MIIQFRVKNYRSISDEQVLSFLTETKTANRNNGFETEFGCVAKSIAVYGANASGKSNVLKALKTYQHIVRTSAERYGKLIYHPFKFGAEKAQTELELVFEIDKKLYRHGFAYTDERIYEEWFFSTDKETKRESEIFYRLFDGKKYNYKYGRNFRGEKKAIEERTREDSLFLSKCALENQVFLKKVFDFLIRRIDFLDTNALYYSSESWDKKTKKKQEKFLKSFGIEFDHLIIEKEKIEMRGEFEIGEELYRPKYFFSRGGKIFSLDEESLGTNALLGVSLPFIYAMEKGKLLVIDEIEKNLHPLIVEQIVNNFHHNVSTNAQLLFTTHNTTILKNSIFNKDQIYFTEKNNYATELYSLLEFKGVRNEDNFEKKYLAGNYGALPILRDFEVGEK